MGNTTANNSLILDLFSKLRGNGLPLIIDDYEDVLNILDNPAAIDFKLESFTSVIQLCRRLWVKSPEQDEIFKTCTENLELLLNKTKLARKKEVELKDKLNGIPSVKKPKDLTDKSLEKHPEPEPSTEPTEEQVIKAIARIAKPDDNYTRFKVSQGYLPASRLQMQQTWHTLHSPQFTSIPTEVDLDGTLRNVEKQGIFFEVKMLPPQQASLELLLLIDRQGSMVPFHGLARELVVTAMQGGNFGKIECYYFENYPDGEFYRDRECWEGKKISSVLSRFDPERTAVLIFSDGGAARGKFNLERLDATEEFLRQLKPCCRKIVWVNPLPKKRWQKTTAQYIAKLTKFLTMFECDRKGWEKAIAHLS